MNFTCTRNKFLEALKVIEHGIGKNINLPILQNVLLRCKKNIVHLVTTDLEIGISTEVFVKSLKEGEYSVPFKTLLTFVQNISEDTLDVQLEKESLVVKTKTTHARIKGEDPSQFPLLPKINKKEYPLFDFSAVPQLLSCVIPTLSPVVTKPELSGVYILLEGKNIICAASDGFRLAEKRMTVKNSYEENKTIIFPHRTSQELIRIFGQNSIQGSLQATIDTHQIFLEHTPEESSNIPPFGLISRLIEGEYPDYQQIIPDSWNTSLIISKALLFSHIRNAGFFSNKLCEVRMKFSPEEQTCTLTTEEHTQGSFTSTIPCKGEGEEQEILVNYRYVLDALQPMYGDEVVIKIKQKDSPVVFASPQENYLSVVMPLRS